MNSFYPISLFSTKDARSVARRCYATLSNFCLHSFVGSFVHSFLTYLDYLFIRSSVCMPAFVRWYFRSLIRYLSWFFVHSFFCLHACICSLVLPFTHSFFILSIRLFILLLVCLLILFTRSLVRSFARSPVRSFLRSSIQSSFHLSIHSTVHSFDYVPIYIWRWDMDVLSL